MVTFFNRMSARRPSKRNHSSTYRPQLEILESRTVPSFADGGGAVITSLTQQGNGGQLVISFEGALNLPQGALSAADLAKFSIQVPTSNAQLVTSSTSSIPIVSGSYSSTSQTTGPSQIALSLGTSLV